MVLSLLKFRKPDVPRVVRIYFSETRLIVAPMHQASTGVYYEQQAPILLAAPVIPAGLGAAFREAFDRFSVTNDNVPGTKKSDWPAFQASGLRSMKAFEQTYLPMLCAGLNSSNAVVRASVGHPTEAGMEISSCFNPFIAQEDVGTLLFRVAGAARRRAGDPE